MMTNQTIYLDYAAATPVDEAVRLAMEPYFRDSFYNPSASYLAAKEVKQALEAARSRLAGVLGANSAEIVFTAGGTEANNLAIKGVMESFPGSNSIVSAIEHEAVLAPAQMYKHKLAAVQKDGILDVERLLAQINSETVLVSVMYANNEIGTVQPIKRLSTEIAKINKQRQAEDNKLPLYLHTDACQAANTLDLHVSRLGVDIMTINGGKTYGPKQSGALYIKKGTVISPQILGGGQEKGRRSGTENVAFAIGLAVAIERAQDMRIAEHKRLSALQTHFIEGLSKLATVSINGSLKQRLASNVHLTFKGQDNERLMMLLDEHGIQCAVGSACAASSDEPSHVLKAIAMSDKQAQESLRFSMGRETNLEQINKTLKLLARCLETKL